MPVNVTVTLSTYATTGSAVRLRAYDSANATADEKAMTESPSGSGQFLYTSTLSLTDNTGPYTWEARVVTAQSQAAFDASTNVVRTRGLLGYVVNGLMLDSTTDIRGLNGLAVTPATSIPASQRTVEIEQHGTFSD